MAAMCALGLTDAGADALIKSSRGFDIVPLMPFMRRVNERSRKVHASKLFSAQGMPSCTAAIHNCHREHTQSMSVT